MTTRNVIAEHIAETQWINGHPVSAMRTLAYAGYDQPSRLSFLMDVIRLSFGDACPFSYHSYIDEESTDAGFEEK